MKPARLAVLGIAVVAAGAAVMLVGKARPPAPTVVQQQAPPPVALAKVLVASAALDVGRTVQDGDVSWQDWPKEALNAQFVQGGSSTAKADVVGAIVRSPFIQGEPIRADKLIKGAGSGFMSAILPSGKRALAISISTNGSASAGGFILPNDHVDVIRTYRDEEGSRTAGAEVQVSETVLTNVRVLAIGKQVGEKNGEKVVTGETATLELDPNQVELVVLAGRVGQLSLALRSLADSGSDAAAPSAGANTGTTVIRYGVATQAIRK
jgi:pilus assembly protein CpaB